MPILTAIAFISMSFTPQDMASLEQVFGRKGTERDGVVRYTFPRRDLKVECQGVKLEPGFALTTWAAFGPMGDHRSRYVMMMGDFVVTEAELPRAQKALLDGGLTITGVHNHIVGEKPGIMYMHYAGKGEPRQLAQAVLAALKTTKTPVEAAPASKATLPDWSEVEKILGVTGAKNGIVLNVGIPRLGIKHEGEPLPTPMGASSSVNFQWIKAGSVAVTSDLVLFPDEVDAVVKALHKAGVTVTALHNHMVYDDPRTFHLHTFAIGRPADLAKAIRTALDLMPNKPTQ
jgi:hypothetical protein